MVMKRQLAADSLQQAAIGQGTEVGSQRSEVGRQRTDFSDGCSFPRPPRLSAPQADDGWQAAAIMKDKAGS